MQGLTPYPYKGIVLILEKSCDLTVCARKAENTSYHTEAARKNELNRKQNYNPNITMISCGSK